MLIEIQNHYKSAHLYGGHMYIRFICKQFKEVQFAAYYSRVT